MDGSEARDLSLLGIGLYTVSDVARLTGISPGRLRRWLRGYAYRASQGQVTMAPLWHSQVPEIDGTLGFGFLDLMEARFVNAFREAKVSWKVIRLCAEKARELIGRDHPFSTRRFKTDGRTIFAETVDQSGETQFLDLARSQLAFARVIAPSLYAGIDFSDRDEPARWWPAGAQHSIVIDPARSFGQPIVNNAGVPTVVLADAVEAEGSVAKVATLFRIAPNQVRAAVQFERRLAERLAA
jgi:uncharacterized protein (DUF433 family)